MIGYRTDQDSNPIIGTAFQGVLGRSQLVTLPEIAANIARSSTEMLQVPARSPARR